MKKKAFFVAAAITFATLLTGCTPNISAENLLTYPNTNLESEVEKIGGYLRDKVKDSFGGIFGQSNQNNSASPGNNSTINVNNGNEEGSSTTASAIPESELYTVISNSAGFTESELERALKPYMTFSKLDRLGRAGTAEGSFCKSILVYNGRADMSNLYPSGWKQKVYSTGITLSDSETLYDRSHLLMEALSDNSTIENLITGTRQMNKLGMLAWESKIVDCIESNPQIHVLYRVIPDFRENELVCRGVTLQAQSVEDRGALINFKVYCYNREHGITIDYQTGDSRATMEE